MSRLNIDFIDFVPESLSLTMGTSRICCNFTILGEEENSDI